MSNRLPNRELIASLANSSDGVAFRAKTGHLHHTWAKTYSSLPELYIQPESVEEIVKVVNLARKLRRRIALVGCGHSPSELTCTSSWLINLDNFSKIISIDSSTRIVTTQSGIRLYALCEELDRNGLAMANLGSINEQSMGGVFATGTHGSSLLHGLISEDIIAIKILLSDGTLKTCSASENEDLFRAALISLGALGIVVEVTFRAAPAFSLRWSQTVDTDAKMLSTWDSTLWKQTHFVRVWWFPYTRRAVVWSAEETTEPHFDPPASYYDGSLGYYVYLNLLYAARYVPSIMPWVEWFVFGMQYGFKNGTTTGAVQPSRKALLMNCLYSQYVNEWAIPLEKGPEALTRLGSWLNRLKPGDRDYVDHKIPVSNDGLWVHAPVEVRVADTTRTSSPRPFLDPTSSTGPTLYLNAIMYRPYLLDPPCLDRFYQGFEWLMRDLGGKPHWAKNFQVDDLDNLYGEDLTKWRTIRDEADPEGMFVGPWHRKFIMGDPKSRLALEECEDERKSVDKNGVRIEGSVLG